MYVCDVQVKGPNLQTRYDHSATAISLKPGLTEVLLFGGIPEWPKDAVYDADFPLIADTTVLTFGESTAWPVSPMHMLVHVVMWSLPACVAYVPGQVGQPLPLAFRVRGQMSEVSSLG